MRFSCVLFDVDGTLVDSAPVVIDVFEDTLPALGLPVPPPAELLKQVGPPLWESFPDLGVAPADVPAAITAYRSRYVERCLEPPLFPGMDDVLARLASTGLPLATATSKQEPMARAQMDHLGLTNRFTVIAGATPGPDSTKATVVRDAIARLAAAGADVSRPVLVGDRIFDLNGAREVGIECIAVGWGYAQPGEMDDADHHAPTPADLLALLLD
ncbi:HAD hydrolase-like protein [Buchananella felis]|uniref:HAD hydrolase-like protein n=1 Tax=Buchananella felis TaxID=3231492 RepID=UPI003528E529